MHDLEIWLADARAAHARLTYIERAIRECSGQAMASGTRVAAWVTRGAEVYTSQSVDALWSAICTLNAHLGGPSLAGEVQP